MRTSTRVDYQLHEAGARRFEAEVPDPDIPKIRARPSMRAIVFTPFAALFLTGVFGHSCVNT
jgi:hypothetical protein